MVYFVANPGLKLRGNADAWVHAVIDGDELAFVLDHGINALVERRQELAARSKKAGSGPVSGVLAMLGQVSVEKPSDQAPG